MATDPKNNNNETNPLAKKQSNETTNSGFKLSKAEERFLDDLSGGRGKTYGRFILAALGAVPWIGGIFGAMAGLSAEKDQEKTNAIIGLWLKEHQYKIQELQYTFKFIFDKLDQFGEDIKDRLESKEYLNLVRQAFRSWDQAATSEKKNMIRTLITNAAAIELCPDDLVRLFIKWIDEYHEAHFIVIKEIYQNPGITRGEIWDKIKGERPREDSAEADLFKYLITELNIGRVIRQEREKNYAGEYIRKRAGKIKGTTPSRTMESAFEDTKGYVLTGLGEQFVHYVMNEVTTQIEEGKNK